MNIAFIEDDVDFQEALKNIIKKHAHKEWNIDYYVDSLDFNKSDTSKYEVIITDNYLPNISGKQLIKNLSKKLHAEFALMSVDLNSFLDEELLEDSKISALIDKNDLIDIIEWIEYFDAKLKIRKNIDIEIKRYSHTIFNGYSIEIKKDISIVRFQDNLLSGGSRDILVHDLQKTNFKCIFYFGETVKATSMLLGQIIYFWNIVKQNKSYMAVVSPSEKLKESFKLCSLDRLITIFDTIEKAENCIEKLQLEFNNIK